MAMMPSTEEELKQERALKERVRKDKDNTINELRLKVI